LLDVQLRLEYNRRQEVKMSYGYEGAMEAAGAEVHTSESFGDYQGTVWAKVTYLGVTGWVSYSYGSCSGCDSYQGTFGYGDDPTPEALAAFGKDYLDPILSQEQAEAAASAHSEWDTEADNVLAFLRKNAIP
jgi:hypothetical protein